MARTRTNAPWVRMPWGKYRGTPIVDLPNSYLFWLISESNLKDNNSLRQALMDEFWERFPPPTPEEVYSGVIVAKNDRGLVKEILRSGFRVLAKKNHPDTGGSHKGFVRLREVYERVMEALDG